MKAKFLLFTAWLLFLSAPAAFGQKDSAFLSRAINAMKLYAEKNPAEKVYLQLDKSDYSFGDTIWYKAYTVIGTHHQLSALSSVLYIELFNSTDSLITRQILRLTAGLAWSEIPLSNTLKTGKLSHSSIYQVDA